MITMNEIDLDKIGKFILKLRTEQGLSQSDLANKVGSSAKTISKWENGGSFPDVLYQRPLCKALGITLEELQAGEYDQISRERQKKISIYQKIMVTILCILFPILIFLSIYFCTHFNTFHIYELTANSSEENHCYASGIITQSYKSKLLYISYINISDYNIKDTDIISADLYSNNEIIYHINNLEPFTVDFTEGVKVNIYKLILKITITEIDNHVHNYEIKFAPNDLLKKENTFEQFDTYSISLLNDDIIMNLKKDGFTESEANLWKKKIITKKKEVTVSVFLNFNKIIYLETAESISKNIIYFDKSKTMEVYIYHADNDIHTLVEKYSYNFVTKEKDCQVGICSTVDEVIKFMQKYISLLTGE